MPENPSPPRPTPQPPVPPPEPLPPNPSPAPLVGETVAIASWAMRHIRHNRLTLHTERRLQSYLPSGNKKRSAGSTLAAQAASL